MEHELQVELGMIRDADAEDDMDAEDDSYGDGEANVGFQLGDQTEKIATFNKGTDHLIRIPLRVAYQTVSGVVLTIQAPEQRRPTKMYQI